MQNFHFHGRKEKGAYTPFTAPYFAFVRLGRCLPDFPFARCTGRFLRLFRQRKDLLFIYFSAVIYTQWV